MAEFRMPSLGADMESGTLCEWKVKPGDRVKRGDVVAVVESDKGAIDLEIWQTGTIERLVIPPGTKVPVHAVLAIVTEDATSAAPVPSPSPAPPPSGAPRAPGLSPPVPASPPPSTRAVRASPAARLRARELEIDVGRVMGTGPGGAITREDVERAAKPQVAAPRARPSTSEEPTPPPVLSASRAAPDMRRAVATAMSRSKREIPHYYLATEIDVGDALAWLDGENGRRTAAERILPAALLLRAVAIAAREIPEMNGFWTEDAFHPAASVHLSVAISLRGGGLVAPALHDADRLPLADLMQKLADLIRRARAGGLRSSELADPTLTVTSLGDQGVDTVFGVIYPPQVALVGLGRIAPRPRAVGALIGVRPTVTATLAADHRASDGHRGALFLAAIDRALRDPEKLR